MGNALPDALKGKVKVVILDEGMEIGVLREEDVA
jgi:hypothetical protein